MICTTWTNGSGSYGLKISENDRDSFFDKNWKEITLLLNIDNHEKQVKININEKSFWNKTCIELINKDIKKWLASIDCINWGKFNPPKFTMDVVNGSIFRIQK